MKKLLSVLLVIAMVLSLAPMALAEDAPADVTTVTVDLTAQADGTFLFAPKKNVEVASNLAEHYGFTDEVSGKVSALDVLIKAHEIMLEDAFTPETAGEYITVSGTFVTPVLMPSLSFAINGSCPNDGVWNETYQAYTGYGIAQAEVKDSDFVELFSYQDTSYLDNYCWFTQGGKKLTALQAGIGSSVTLGVSGYCYCYYGCSKQEMIDSKTNPIEDAHLAWVNAETGALEDITDAVTGEDGQATITMPEAGGSYYLSAYITAEDITDYYATPMVMPLLPVQVVDTSITVPSDATLFVGKKVKHFVPFTAVEPVQTVSNAEAGTTTYYYDLENGQYNYRVSGDGYITYAEIFSKAATPYTKTVTDAELKPEGKTPKTIDRDVTSNSGYNVADLYLNINPQNYLKLNKEDTYQLVNLRSWEAVNSTTGNYFIEPDYHYTVVDESGKASSDVVTVSNSGLITAVGSGTAIVLVTYDAINIEGAAGGPFFGAIWPENTGVFVVSVDAADSGITTGMTINEGKNADTAKLAADCLDAEHDVIYFTGDKGSYTFTPTTAGCTVSVVNPTVADAMTFSGFTAVSAGADGSVTVPLVQGRNIVKVAKDGKAEYQVITAKKVSYTINNGEPVHPGDPVSIVFDRVYHPAGKLAGVYNMSASMVYSDVDGYEGKLVGSVGNQYKFASTAAAQTVANEVTRNATAYAVSYKKGDALTVPADYDKDTFTLSGGTLVSVGFGDPYGNHRGITLTDGKDPNFTASVREGFLGRLPDIQIPIVATDAALQEIALTTDGVKTTYFVGDTFDTSNLVVTAKYADGKTQIATNYTVTPAVLTADTTKVTITYRDKTADLNVTVKEPVLTSIAVTTPPAKTTYTEGDVFDPTGMVVTGTYENGKTEVIKDYMYSPRELKQTDTQITVTCGSLTATTPISVGAAGEVGKTVAVQFTLLGDKEHGEPTGEADTHTYKAGNLETWIEKTEITVPENAKVVDVIAKALGLAGIPYENPDGNYIESVRGIGQFTNGSLSGWMYLLNGAYSELGVDEQTVKAGDEIIFHYTDDYTAEWEAPVPVKEVFNDLVYSNGKDHWAMEAVQYVYDNGLMNGMKPDVFGPEIKLDRSQLVTILWRMEGSPKDDGTGKQFQDVSKTASNTSWFYDAVAWASANGVVNGKSETTFDPFALVTREQAAAMFHRYAAYKDKDDDTRADLSKFVDAGKVSTWAKEDLAWANQVGLINGQTGNKLAPLDGATRAEAATILMRFCEQILK